MPKKTNNKGLKAVDYFNEVSRHIAKMSGHPITFFLAVVVVILWLVGGPVFGFSDTWQLIINTATTIITFLMVFLIQNTQNRDSESIELKLDELLVHTKSPKEFVKLEEMSEEEIERLIHHFEKLKKKDK